MNWLYLFSKRFHDFGADYRLTFGVVGKDVEICRQRLKALGFQNALHIATTWPFDCNANDLVHVKVEKVVGLLKRG